MKTFEKTVPDGYPERFHLSAKSTKTAIIMNLAALLIAAAVILTAVLLVKAFVPESFFGTDEEGGMSLYMSFFVGIICGSLGLLVYIVLHELTHGAVYKKLTGEKLTFGLTISVAFCGVPNIYVYRRTAIIACAMPLTVFSALFIPMGIAALILTAVFESLAAFGAFVAITFIFAFHLGGCIGDMYVIFLMLSKFKSPDTLMRDTGPEQFFYTR